MPVREYLLGDLGAIRCEADERGLRRITLLLRTKRPITSVSDRFVSDTDVMRRCAIDVALRRWIAGYLGGAPVPFAQPLRLAEGTDFQRAVWAAIAHIPFGQTRTYGELARVVGRPRAVRAVGQACGANPVPLIVPCHRVVAASGVGGFSGPAGWKRRLLAFEQIREKNFDKRPRPTVGVE